MLIPSISFADVPSVIDYQNKEEPTQYDLYIYGLASGLDWANELMFSKHSIDIYCKPRELDLSSKQLRKMIDEEISNNKAFYDKYNAAPLLGLAIRNAYISNFPCN